MDRQRLEDWYYRGSYDEITDRDPDQSSIPEILRAYQVLVYTTTGQHDRASDLLSEISHDLDHQNPLIRLVSYFAKINHALKTRDLDTAHEDLKKAEKFYDTIDDPSDEVMQYYGVIQRLLGTYHSYVGDFIQATEIFSSAITIQQQYGFQYELPRLYSNRAATLYWLGDIEGALENGLTAYKYLQEQGIEGSENIVGVTNNIGLIYVTKNQPDKAIDFFTRSLEASRQLGNAVYIALNTHNLIRSYNLKEDFVTARDYLEHFPDRNHPFIAMLYRLSKAMLYLHSTRIQEVAEGQRVITEMINQPILDHQFTILGIFTAVDYLLLELEHFNDTTLLGEINDLLTSIDEIATVKAVRPALVQSYIIRSRLELLRGELKEAEYRLEYAREIAEDLNLKVLVEVIDTELQEISKQYHVLGISDDSRMLSMKTANLTQLVRDIRHNQLIARYDRVEDPVFLIIINDAGMPIYSKKFTKDLNEYLISGFLTAVSSFGPETFEIDSYANKLQFQNTSILLEKHASLTFTYASENDTLQTSHRFSNFVTYVTSNTAFTNYLKSTTLTNPMGDLPGEIQEILEQAINTVLLPKS